MASLMIDGAARVQQEPHVGATDWVARARAITPLIEAQVARSEVERTLPQPVVEALKDTDLFWMFTPVEAGGGGCGYRDLIEVIEQLSYADASAGWSFMANVESTAAAAAFCGDSAVDAMFGGRERGIMAGMLGPGGKGVAVDGGYRAGGHFSFGSGSAHATWLGGGMMVIENGKPRMLPHGPEVQIAFVPRERVAMEDNWDVRGLSATGSYDYEIPEQFIGGDFAFERATAEPQRGGPAFSLGFAPIVSAGHVAVILGIMKRALQEIARIACEKKRVGYPSVIADHALFMHEFGKHEALAMAARHYSIEVFAGAEVAAADGRALTEYEKARFRQVASWVHQVGADVVRFCYTASGAEGFRASTPIGRAFRDMYVATNHLFIDPVNIANVAPVLLDHYRRGAPAAGSAA